MNNYIGSEQAFEDCINEKYYLKEQYEKELQEDYEKQMFKEQEEEYYKNLKHYLSAQFY